MLSSLQAGEYDLSDLPLRSRPHALTPPRCNDRLTSPVVNCRKRWAAATDATRLAVDCRKRWGTATFATVQPSDCRARWGTPTSTTVQAPQCRACCGWATFATLCTMEPGRQACWGRAANPAMRLARRRKAIARRTRPPHAARMRQGRTGAEPYPSSTSPSSITVSTTEMAPAPTSSPRVAVSPKSTPTQGMPHASAPSTSW